MYVRDIVGLVLDHHSKVSLTNFLVSQVYESYTIVILLSIKCVITLGLKKKQYPYLGLKCLLLKMLTIT